MTSVRDVHFANLARSAQEGVSEYVGSYLDALPQLTEIFADNAKLTSKLDLHVNDETSAIYRASLIYNDATFMSILGAEQAFISWMTPEWFGKNFSKSEVIIRATSGVNEELLDAIKRGEVGFGFFQGNDETTTEILKDVAPFIARGWVIPRPSRTFFYARPHEAGAQRNWIALEADPMTHLDTWSVKLETANSAQSSVSQIVYDERYSSLDPYILSELVVPYVSDIPSEEYAKIVEDEFDLVLALRKELKTVLANLPSERSAVRELMADVIRPRIAKIDRQFRHICNMRRLKVGGATLATTSLALIAYASSGLAAGVEAVAGGAGFMTVVKEFADHEEKLDGLRDDPFYLLWKLSRKRIRNRHTR